MKKLLPILLLLLGCWACKQKNTTPEGILPKDKMVSFLIDMHIAEARINDLSLRRDSAERFFKIVEDSLFRKNGITNDSIYIKSYEYYLRDVEGLDEIYSAVVDSLSLRERLSKEKESEIKEEEKEKKVEAKNSAASDTLQISDTLQTVD